MPDTRTDFAYTTDAGVEVVGSRSILTRTNQKVWALTTFRRQVDPDRLGGQHRDYRTVGLFKRRSQAFYILRKDIGDLDEAGYYQYAVIEPLPLTLYPTNKPEDRLWFEHHRDTNRWVQLPAEPEEITAIYRTMGAGGVPSWATIG